MRHVEAIRRLGDALAGLTPRRGMPAAGPPAHVGVLLQWGIGDAVLAQPLLAALRARWPATRITALGKPWLPELFAGEGLVDGYVTLVPPWTSYQGKYRVWEKAWRVFARQVLEARRTRFDLLVALRWDAREVGQLRLLRAARTAAFAMVGGRRWVTVDLGLGPHEFGALHRSEVAAHAAHRLTGATVSSIPALAAAPAHRQRFLDALRHAGWTGGTVLAVHAGAGNPVREWPTEKFNAVLKGVAGRVGCLVVIDDGAAAARLDPPAGIPLLRWAGSLTDLKALLSACDVLLCNDAGPMHVAAAVGCRTVAVFGPTSVTWFGPRGDGHRVVLVEPMPCRPCLDSCIYDSPRCMDGVDVGMVSAALQETLATATQKQPSPAYQDHGR